MMSAAQSDAFELRNNVVKSFCACMWNTCSGCWRMQETGLFDSSTLPALPRNARYVFHANQCYDWGTFGWAISEGKVDTRKYRSFIFMNSSVRGPFLPVYIPVRSHPLPSLHCWDSLEMPHACAIPALCGM